MTDDITKKLEKARKLFDRAKAKYDKTLEDICFNCAHDWQYVPDPSGNNDSAYICIICKKWTKRNPKL